MQRLDSIISIFVNSFANRSWFFDEVISFLESNSFLKAEIVLALFFYVWFQPKKDDAVSETIKKRQILLHSLIVCVPGMLIVRVLAATLPFRTRPLYNTALHLKLAAGLNPHLLETWSSFPSDHMVMFFTLATAMFLVNRKIGYILYAHAILVIGFPRLYLGIHYTSDLVVGSVIGFGLGYSGAWTRWRNLVTGPAWRLYDGHPGFFYAGFFLLSHETATMYSGLHGIYIEALKLLRLVAHAILP